MQELINNVVLNLEQIIFSVPPFIGLLLGMLITLLITGAIIVLLFLQLKDIK